MRNRPHPQIKKKKKKSAALLHSQKEQFGKCVGYFLVVIFQKRNQVRVLKKKEKKNTKDNFIAAISLF